MEKTELTETSRKNDLNKKFVMLIVMSLLFTCAVFAADNTSNNNTISGASTLKDVFQTIYTFFTSAAVRVIAIAGVIITGIKIITNKGNPDAAKPLIWIFIACIIIGSASWFVDKFLGDKIAGVDNMGGTSWY